MRSTFVDAIVAALIILSSVSGAYASKGLTAPCERTLLLLSGVHFKDPDVDGFHENEKVFKVLLNYHITEEKNLKAYRHGSFGEQKINIIQLGDIKDLSEKKWNYSGTEALIELVHVAFHEILSDDPHLGHIIHSTYKNHFVVSPLDPQEFQSKVVSQVVDLVSKWMEHRIEVSPKLKGLVENNFSLGAWLSENLVIAQGANPRDAQFLLKNTTGLSYEQWRTQAVARRAYLVKEVQEHKVKWNDVIDRLHDYIARENGGDLRLLEFLRPIGLEQIFFELKNYLFDMSVGDFFPLPEFGHDIVTFESFMNARRHEPLGMPRATWEVEKRVSLANARGSKFVAVTDIEGLGRAARREQDAWMGRGADLTELPVVYSEISTELHKLWTKLFSDLQTLVAPYGKVMVYQGGGDEATWFFPDIPLKTRTEIETYLTALKSREKSGHQFGIHSSQLVEVKIPQLFESLRSAEHGAHLNLTKNKHSPH